MKKEIRSSEKRRRDRTTSRKRGRERCESVSETANMKSLTEEVVEAVLASRLLRHDTKSHLNSDRNDDWHRAPLTIVNIAWHDSWMLNADQAALRRILMNIYSESLALKSPRRHVVHTKPVILHLTTL